MKTCRILTRRVSSILRRRLGIALLSLVYPAVLFAAQLLLPYIERLRAILNWTVAVVSDRMARGRNECRLGHTPRV